ncbi:MAG: hypothetical protein J1E00_00180 [Oscillospiraceae bacterium]|nr:hypothetical protein [Oscillospiraceae bacterium]
MMRGRSAAAVIALLLASVFLLASCGAKPDEETYQLLSGLQTGLESRTRAETGFWMEASFRDPDTGKSGVLYSLDGETRYDTASQTAWQRFTVTRLGATAAGEEYYADGTKTHLEGGQVKLLPTEPEVMFGAFPYRLAPLPAFSELKSTKTEENGSGMLYTLVTAAGQQALIEEIWGLDLYALAGISSPDREKESYGDVTYTWSVTDGKVQTLYVELTVSLFEKTGYTPGYSGGKDDGRLDLTIRTRLSFRNTGDAVEIPTYEAAE